MNKISKKCGFINILGGTNVGKSTLLNRLVGQKVSIISRKVQTTRNSITGIFCLNLSQIIIIDTPGIFSPKRKFDRAMINVAWNSIANTDITILMVEPIVNIDENTQMISKYLKKQIPKKLICVINKIDKVDRKYLLETTNLIKNYFDCEEYFYLSALKGDGVNDFKSYLSNSVPEGPWHFPEEQVTNISYRLLVAELVREKLIDRLHHELPYQLAVETEDWNELEDGSIRIDILVYVNKEGQKKIVIGKNGNNLKVIGTNIRKDLKKILEKDVHLFLYVKIKKNWDNSPNYYKSLGLEFNV